MQFEGGATVSFTMIAFTEKICARQTKIYGTKVYNYFRLCCFFFFSHLAGLKWSIVGHFFLLNVYLKCLLYVM